MVIKIYFFQAAQFTLIEPDVVLILMFLRLEFPKGSLLFITPITEFLSETEEKSLSEKGVRKLPLLVLEEKLNTRLFGILSVTLPLVVEKVASPAFSPITQRILPLEVLRFILSAAILLPDILPLEHLRFISEQENKPSACIFPLVVFIVISPV